MLKMPHSGKLSISRASGQEMNDQNDQNGRFSVKRVGTLDNDDTLAPTQDALDGLSPHQYSYVCDTKSLGQLTREALPQLENYRDVASVHAAARPTLDELHNATYIEKVSEFLSFQIQWGKINLKLLNRL